MCPVSGQGRDFTLKVVKLRPEKGPQLPKITQHHLSPGFLIL